MRELSIYIKTDKKFKQFIEDFNELFHMNLKIREEADNRLMCKFYLLDIETLLYDNHGMEDDMGIAFSQYDFCLSLDKINRGGVSEEYDNLYNSIAKYYIKRLSDEFNAKCILVEDSQRLLT